MKEIKINTLKALAETNYLNLYECGYENKLGQKKQWVIASRKDYETLNGQYFDGQVERVDAVVLVPYHEETQELVLVKQFRVPLNDYIYELPAGLIDQGEEVATSVARELKEETGLTLKSIDYEKSLMKTYLSAGMTDESVALIYCTCGGKLSKDFLEEDEDITPMLVSKERAKELLSGKEKIDIKAYMILQQFINQ